MANPSHSRSDEHLSLTSNADRRAPDEELANRLAIGVALLGLGLVAPLAGFLFAEVRWRRAQAQSGRRR